MDISSLDSYYSNIYSNATNLSADKLSESSDKDYSNATDDELMDVCKEFESYFVEQMYKEMYKTVSDSSEDSSGANSTMVDYFKDQMIQSIAEETTSQGSLGLAQMLYEQMKRNVSTDVTQSSQTSEETSGTDSADKV